MKRIRLLAVLLAATLLLGGCRLFGSAAHPVYTELPLSGEDVPIGYHDDDYGFHILNRFTFVQPSGYDAKLTAHSYQTLSTDRQRELYDEIYNAAFCFSDQKSVYEGEYAMRPLFFDGTDYTAKEVEAALIAVIDDHPELFWMTTDFDLKTHMDTGSTEVIVNASYPVEEVVAMMHKLNDALKRFYDEIPPSLMPYEREVYVYKYIIGHCEYDENISSTATYGDEHPSLFNLYGVMVDHKAVCEGYSYSFDFLCSHLGIDTVCICGATDSEGDKDVGKAASNLHIWNAVELDGDWYMVDCTWDDLDHRDDYGEVFTYLNVTDKVLGIDHTPDPTYAQLSDEAYRSLTSYVNNFLPPACTATKYCYYLNESVHLTSPDVRQLADGIVEAVRKKRTSVMICIDSDRYTPDTMAKALFEGDQVYYQAMHQADDALTGSPLNADADAAYYPIYDLNMLAFKLNYE